MVKTNNNKRLIESVGLFMVNSNCHVHEDGTKSWCAVFNGQKEFHREDGPAIEWANGDKEYWFNGYAHRMDGPAIDYVDGTKCWYIHGEKLTEEEFNKRVGI